MSDLSWLNPTPHAIAVYASQPLSPVATQHSLPSGRYSLLGPDFHRLDRTSFAWRTHSITSSARASSVGGTRCRAPWRSCRLMTSSNLVGCSTGRSAGFAPLRISIDVNGAAPVDRRQLGPFDSEIAAISKLAVLDRRQRFAAPTTMAVQSLRQIALNARIDARARSRARRIKRNGERLQMRAARVKLPSRLRQPVTPASPGFSKSRNCSRATGQLSRVSNSSRLVSNSGCTTLTAR